MNHYIKDPLLNLHWREDFPGLPYSDGQVRERDLYHIVRNAADRSTFSIELLKAITDWPSEYHLSRQRHCLVRPLGIKAGDKVLEFGCGCGAITRYLGELGADVLAIEGGVARARIAAERCRDLPNVKVIADDFLQFRSDQKFDWILLIGVLEYAPIFSPEQDPVDHYLRRTTSFVAPGGRIVVAIENKLGLKYFNGCGEDHLGVPFCGIQGLYAFRTPQTFGRRELELRLVASGLRHLSFYYPFPDYKLPQIILSDTALSDPDFDPANLLLAAHARDYTNRPYRLFDDALVLREIALNGLLGELSNSFLVLASREPVEPDRSTLAVTYAVQRVQKFATRTRFVRAGTAIKVFKETLYSAPTREVGLPDGSTIRNVGGEFDYLRGKLSAWRLSDARALRGQQEQIVEALYPWFRYLCEQCGAFKEKENLTREKALTEFSLQGGLLDLAPFSLIETGDDQLTPIDLEWVIDRDIPLGFVVTRSVLHALRGTPGFEQTPIGVADVVKALAVKERLKVSDEEIGDWLRRESELLAAITDYKNIEFDPNICSHALESFDRFISRLQTSMPQLGKQIPQRDKKIAELSEQIAQRNAAIVKLNDELNEIFDSTVWRLLAPVRWYGRQRQHARIWVRVQFAGVRRAFDRLFIARWMPPILNRMFFSSKREGSPRYLTLAPWQNVEFVTRFGSATEWRISGDDPQFDLRFDPDAYLPPAHYNLILDLPQGWDDLASAVLYVDTGRGFNDEQRVKLHFHRWSRDSAAATIFLNEPTLSLRLDPSIREGRFVVGAVRLQKIDRLSYYARLLTIILTKRIYSPGALLLSGVKALIRGGPRELAAEVRRAADQGMSLRADMARRAVDYQRWIAQYDTITNNDVTAMRHIAQAWANKPKIAVVMPVYNTPRKLLCEAIESVLKQSYAHWELCIADDCSTEPHVKRILEKYASSDQRIKLAFRDENGHISRASNTAIGLASADWIALLDHDDLLAPHALFCVADAILKNPNAKLFYSDEDKIDFGGKRRAPYFKCDWNYDLFLSHNLITHLGIYDASLVRSLGGFREGFEGAQDYDLALRVVEKLTPDQIHHIPHVLYHWRITPGSTALSNKQKPYSMIASERAINEHLCRCNKSGRAQLLLTGYRIDYDLPDPPPLVSIIIPTRNARALVAQCIDSIRQRTTYPKYEIILVDNGSDEPEALHYFATLEHAGLVDLIKDARPFNYSALNNLAARRAKGAVLALLNNDVEVVSPDWLERMVSIALQPGVGAVGAKLLFPDDESIQHGGVVMGLGGLASHAHWGLPDVALGYAGRAGLAQNFSAVTGACLVVRKDLYFKVDGLNETDLAIAYNDVDFCLKLTQIGLRNVWTPFAKLYHYESATRVYETTLDKVKRFRAEQAYMKHHWKSFIDNDPAYSPNLTLQHTDFSYAFPPRVQKPWKSSMLSFSRKEAE